VKKKKKAGSKLKAWGILFAVIFLAQMGTLYGLDRFLASPSTSAIASAKAAGNGEEPPIQVPPEAVNYALSADKQEIAYTTNDQKLIIATKQGIAFQDEVGNVTHMEWLGESDTLCYFVQGSSLTAYLIQSNQTEPVLIHKWRGREREVVNTYFSPYMEFLYIELKDGPYNEIYKYDAVGGVTQLPLGDIKIDHIDYDSQTDILLVTSDQGETWRYENGKLYRPDGKRVYVSEDQNQSPETTRKTTKSHKKVVQYLK
jgi:hypothetical protein